ncbi:MAG: phosphatidate cytidylyltransferase [Sphingobacteriales bacterium]|nr:MAG: phosphatidate cytidylyltransferase [Sphingobacteriales bacterium]
MPLDQKTLLVRTGSAIVFGILMLAGLLGPFWGFGLLVLLIHFLCLREAFQLFNRILKQPPAVGTEFIAQLFGLGLLIAMMVPILLQTPFFSTPSEAATHAIPEIFSNFWIAGLVLYPALLLLGTALSKKVTPIAAAEAFTGHLYITLSMALLLLLRVADSAFPVILITAIWMNDSFAYLCGSLFGRTPMTSISPKKTWEGTLGGAVLTLAAGASVSYFMPQYSYKLTMGLALCAALPGNLGDLLESRLKRLAGVKDSGAIMPGHGGALDRFDSLLIATPFAFCYLYLLDML